MSPTDADFDDMHHALGRPAGRHVERFRNHYVIDVDAPQATRFKALSDHWRLAGTINEGGSAVFKVTDVGRLALFDWLDRKNAAAGLRTWSVSGPSLEPRMIVAKSASAARYHVYLSLSDIWGLSFRDFLRLGVCVRAA